MGVSVQVPPQEIKTMTTSQFMLFQLAGKPYDEFIVCEQAVEDEEFVEEVEGPSSDEIHEYQEANERRESEAYERSREEGLT